MTLVALAVAGAAWYSSRQAAPVADAASVAGSPLFPGLAKKTASVQTIKVLSKGATFTLVKQGEVWGMSEKGGYAVNFDKVKDLVAKLAYFKIIEKKTDRPELFSKLELEDPSAAEAKSTQVTISDASGAVLADILIGKSSGGGGPGLASTFVRRPAENQTYEASGTVSIDGIANNWLDKQVIKLERARVHKVETTQADGSKLVLSKTAPDDKNFGVLDLPVGAELKWPGVADGVAGALEYLNFDDVQAAGSVDFSAPTATTTTMQTFDGMLVTVKVLENEGKFYGQFSARFDPSLRVEVTKFEAPPPAGPEVPKPADPNAPAEADPAAAIPPPAQPIETKSVPGKKEEEVAKEASELDARLSKWTYVLPGYAASNFTKKMSDMLKEVAPVEPVIDPNAPLPPTDGVVPAQDPTKPVDDGHGHEVPAVPTGGGGGR